MAARKGSTGRKKKKTTSAKGQTRKKEVYDSRSMETEIILWIILAASAVLLVSNFGIGGAVGNAISSFFFGLVGLVCYPLPFFPVYRNCFCCDFQQQKSQSISKNGGLCPAFYHRMYVHADDYRRRTAGGRSEYLF